MIEGVLWLALWLMAGLALVLGAPGWLLGLTVLPAVIFGPGWGWARWLHTRRGGPSPALQVALDSAWLGIGGLLVTVSLVRELSLAAWALLPLAAALGLPGLVLAWRRQLPLQRPGPRVLLGLGALLLALGFFAWRQAPALARPLDAYWWHRAPDEAAWERTPLHAPGFTALGWDEAGAVRAALPAGEITLTAQAAGPLLVALRGDVGARIWVDQGGTTLGEASVEASPTEAEEEGPVARYLARGVAAAFVHAAAGPLTLRTSAPGVVYLLPSQDAVWSLDETGELRFVHYYQCLNIAENQRWAAATLADLRATVNQPPLWAYVLAVPTALISPDLKGAGLLFLWVLGLAGLAGLRLLELAAPKATWPAWVLPSLAVLVHGRLMTEPGSFNFPDSLYAAALVSGMAALLAGAPGRSGLLAVAGSLLRYPGAVVIAGAVLLQALLEGRARSLLRLGLRLGAIALALAGLVAGVGLVTGDLAEWSKILWFETFAEHWHGEGSIALLAPRIPSFYLTWLLYAGGAPLLAVVAARGRALLILLVAAAYSLLLCTIDHSPTHYFLPLVHLSTVALAAGAGGMRERVPGYVLLALGIAGLGWSALFGHAI
ncbi:MAG: hypothetical protein ABIO70_28720 [Pseudomonadota bacterium]